MDLHNKKILVIGLGKSGAASAQFLRGKGALVTAVDACGSGAIRDAAKELEKQGVTCRIGDQAAPDLDGIDLIIVSPGVPDSNMLVAGAISKNITVLSEPELASRFTKATIIAITGTNGKTTTTTLIGEILKASGREVIVTGNIGYPMISAVQEISPSGYLVVEMSSFQLDHTVSFAPHVAVLLNITKDHLDRYDTFMDYVRSKSKLFANQEQTDFAIINADDENAAAAASGTSARLIWTSKSGKREDCAYLDGDKLMFSNGEESEICRRQEVQIIGEHNIDNILAASAACHCLKINIGTIHDVLKKFRGLPHRLQQVGEIRGVRFFDDSKATNPDAVVKALTAFNEPLILLLGGRNKGYDFGDLAESAGKVKKVIAFGESAEDIARDFSSYGLDVEIKLDLTEAFSLAREMSEPGDVVLLSPACASFDQYSNYQARGEHFKQLVNEAAKIGSGI